VLMLGLPAPVCHVSGAAPREGRGCSKGAGLQAPSAQPFLASAAEADANMVHCLATLLRPEVELQSVSLTKISVI